MGLSVEVLGDVKRQRHQETLRDKAITHQGHGAHSDLSRRVGSAMQGFHFAERVLRFGWREEPLRTAVDSMPPTLPFPHLPLSTRRHVSLPPPFTSVCRVSDGSHFGPPVLLVSALQLHEASVNGHLHIL